MFSRTNIYILNASSHLLLFFFFFWYLPEGDGYDLQDRADETKSFNCWLQCYYQKGMKNMADHNGRTIWFSGPAGPMAPKGILIFLTFQSQWPVRMILYSELQISGSIEV